MKLKDIKIMLMLCTSVSLVGCGSLPFTQGNNAPEAAAPVSDSSNGGYYESTGTTNDGWATANGTANGGDGWDATATTVTSTDTQNGAMLSTLTVYFDYDISEIRRDFHEVVISHGNYLANNPNVTLTIEGHCDENGSREYNIGLGEHRANAVKSLLMAQGVSEQQLITISYGEERPAIEGSTEESWSLNRRVELVY